MDISNDQLSVLCQGMRFDPTKINTDEEASNMFKAVKDAAKAKTACKKKQIEWSKAARFVAYLYSQDTFLNKRPIKPLQERQGLSMMYAGFERNTQNAYSLTLIKLLCDLDDKYFFEFVFSFLKYQNNPVWVEIVTLRQQLYQNQKMRMAPVKNVQDIDKKNNLTKHYNEWIKYLKDYEAEFYGDHENVKNIASGLSHIKSIETLAR